MSNDLIALPLTENLPLDIPSAPTTSPIVVRPIGEAEGFRRLEAMRSRMGIAPQQPSAGEDHERLRKEADVVDAARRSQAEIRRHVDSYLKEHFETIGADIANVVIAQVNERILKGVAGLEEAQAIRLDQLAADIRKQLRVFAREAWSPAKKAKAKRGR